MKNIIQINQKDSCEVEIVYSTNIGDDSLFLDIYSNTEQNPRLQIGGGDVILGEHTEYEVAKNLFIGSDTLTFKIIDSTGTYQFNIAKTMISNGTVTIKQVDNFNYELRAHKPSRSLEQLEASVTGLETYMTNANNQIDFIKSKYYAFTNAIEIGKNEDLNNYMTPGNYFCGWNDIVETLLNCPANKNAFTLKVDYSNGTEYYIMQTLRLYRTGATFCRHYIVNSNIWSTWYMQNQAQYEYTKGSVKILRVGNVVTYNALAWQNERFQIPYGYTPMENLYAPALIRRESPVGFSLGTIYITKGNGVVKVYDDTFTTTTNHFLASVTWVTDDLIPF